MKKNFIREKISLDLYLEPRFSFNFFWIIICILLEFFIASCSSPNAKTYIYLTELQQRVLELCALVFSAPYYQYISPSRSVKLKQIHTTSWGFWASFQDGRTYKVPIPTGLDLGENYYCNYSKESSNCYYKDDNFDERC